MSLSEPAADEYLDGVIVVYPKRIDRCVATGRSGLIGTFNRTNFISMISAPTHIVGLENPAFLVAVDRVLGGVQIERDARRGHGVRVQEKIDGRTLDRFRSTHDLVIAAALSRGVFQLV